VRATNRSYIFFRITGLSHEGEPVGARVSARARALDRGDKNSRLRHAVSSSRPRLPIETPSRRHPSPSDDRGRIPRLGHCGPARADLYWGGRGTCAPEDCTAPFATRRLRHAASPRELDMVESANTCPSRSRKPQIPEAGQIVGARQSKHAAQGRGRTRSKRLRRQVGPCDGGPEHERGQAGAPGGHPEECASTGRESPVQQGRPCGYNLVPRPPAECFGTARQDGAFALSSCACRDGHRPARAASRAVSTRLKHLPRARASTSDNRIDLQRAYATELMPHCCVPSHSAEGAPIRSVITARAAPARRP